MAITAVQTNTGSGSGTSITVSLLSAPSASSLIVIQLWVNGNTTITAPTSFTKATGSQNSKLSGAVMSATGLTSTSYSVALGTSSAHVVWTVREWSGAAGIGVTSSSTYTQSSSAITETATLTAGNSASQLATSWGCVGNPSETINSTNWTNNGTANSGTSARIYSDLYGLAAGTSAVSENVTMSAVTNGALQGFMFEITPSATTPTYTASAQVNQTASAQAVPGFNASIAVKQSASGSFTLTTIASAANKQSLSAKVAPSFKSTASAHQTLKALFAPTFKVSASVKQTLKAVIQPAFKAAASVKQVLASSYSSALSIAVTVLNEPKVIVHIVPVLTAKAVNAIHLSSGIVPSMKATIANRLGVVASVVPTVVAKATNLLSAVASWTSAAFAPSLTLVAKAQAFFSAVSSALTQKTDTSTATVNTPAADAQTTTGIQAKDTTIEGISAES